MKKLLLTIALFFLLALPASAEINNGLFLWYSFDSNDISGTSVTDLSGQGNTGTTAGSPTKTYGQIGQALSFTGANGSGQQVSASSFNGFSVGNNITISAWVKPSAVDGTQNVIIQGSTNSDLYQRMEIFTNNKYDIDIGSGAAWCGFPTQPFSINVAVAGQWTLVTGTYDGTNERLYVNGVFQNLHACAISTGKPNGVTIGQYDTATGYEFPGAVDDVRFYNRALSAGDVQALYYNGLYKHFNWPW